MITNKILISSIRDSVFHSIGCTDPVAIGLASAKVNSLVGGEIKNISLILDKNIYKNAFAITIPGTNKKGIEFAIALGVIAGNPDDGLLLFKNITPDHIQKAKLLVKKGIICIDLNTSAKTIFIQAKITTSKGEGEVCIQNRHDHFTLIRKNNEILFQSDQKGDDEKKTTILPHDLTLDEVITILNSIPESEFDFLIECVDINLKAVEIGLLKGPGMALGQKLRQLIDNGSMDDSLVNAVKRDTAAAADARMGGENVKIAGCGGSGNHGITLFITLGLAYEGIEYRIKKDIRKVLAFSIVVLNMIKQRTGILTPMCGCAVAAGAATAAGLTYAISDNTQKIENAIHLTIGNLAGMICDGAKSSCAVKISCSAGEAIQTALLSLEGVRIPGSDGIIASTLNQSLNNLEHIQNKAMRDVDLEILNILKQKQHTD